MIAYMKVQSHVTTFLTLTNRRLRAVIVKKKCASSRHLSYLRPNTYAQCSIKCVIAIEFDHKTKRRTRTNKSAFMHLQLLEKTVKVHVSDAIEKYLPLS